MAGGGLGRATALAALLTAQPAAAAVIEQNAGGFAVAHTARVAATPGDVWAVLRVPAKWWSADHSWSGDAANFWLDAQPGGCFCEKLPGDALGGVAHGRVMFAQPGRLLRLDAALGPLQADAVTGRLTIQIQPVDGGSAVRMDYRVGGQFSTPIADLAPVVDAVIGDQLKGLAAALGGALPPPPAPAASADAPPPE